MKNKKVISFRGVELNIPYKENINKFVLPAIARIILKRKKLKNSSVSKEKIKNLVLLKNINLDIHRGERVALIGQNGAGKTTFLRLLSGIYLPSKGRLLKKVNVHPVIYKGFLTSNELNGYAAAKAHYLLTNKSLQGFEKYIEDVKNFSGLGDYLYKPVKIYSDGMQARLLFSIITGFKHDCLAMDEGIGAGDKNFIIKAQDRLNEFIKSSGTLILASHTNSLLKKFCTRGLVFDNGEIKYDGNLTDALNYYDSM